MAATRDFHKGLKIGHYNIRSLYPKLDSFKLWIDESRFDCLTISETWLNPLITNAMLDLDGYELYRLDRSNSAKTRGGGLLTIFHRRDGLLINDRTFAHLCRSTPDIEIQFLNVKIGNLKKMIVINCYRPPSGKSHIFFDCLHESLDQISKIEEYEVFLCGDLNIPYGDEKSHEFGKLKTLENKYSLTQLINLPTRITARTSTTLDLILTNSRYIETSGTEEINMSDHEPVFAIRKKQKVRTTKVDFECRCFAAFNKDEFQADLVTRSWDEYYQMEDVDNLWETLYDVIYRTADRHCPLKSYRGKKVLPQWLTPELHELMFERDFLYKKAKRSRTEEDWLIARRLRNLCNSSIRMAKNDYTKLLLKTHKKVHISFGR